MRLTPGIWRGVSILTQLSCYTSTLSSPHSRASSRPSLPGSIIPLAEMSSIYFSSNHRSTNSREKARLTNGLPSYSAAVQEKLYRHGRSPSWLVPISAPIPGISNRRFRLWVPNPARIHQGSVARFGRKRGTLLLCFGVFLFVFITFAVHKRFTSSSKQWPKFPTGDPPTLVFTRADLQRIWKWEIESGHYPSSQKSTDSFSFDPSFPPIANLFSPASFLFPWSLALPDRQFQKRSASRQWSQIQPSHHGKPLDCRQGYGRSQSRSRARTVSVSSGCTSMFNHQIL